ncbi:MAG: PIG-L family deacetylase, partial [Clostridia bacterium]|nr:PIG-L family deacetylase [Clostridia bacterium]
ESEFLYTAEGMITSDIGKTHTYGTEEYPDYHTMLYNEPAAYTRENLKSDIKDLILNLRPTVIYCIDFDVHVDHRTLSLLFEEAMPYILTKDASYQPRVYKGFAYVKDDYLDFYVGLNERSVQKPVTHLILDDTYDTDVPSYTWKNRVRLPSADGLFGWTRRSSYINELLAMYESQNDKSFPRNTNSDDIFWERRTDSLTYNAELSVSSGMYKEHLADFKLTDVSDVGSKKTTYTNFLWSPELSDEQKSLTFTFATPQEVSAVALYDDPNVHNNILCAKIEDADGNLLAKCMPSAKGEYSIFEFPAVTTDKITVSIVAYEGIPGLAEVEIFRQGNRETEWIKLYSDNENETFVYHVYPEEDTVALRLYAYPNNEKAIEDYDILVDGEAEWKTENDRLIIDSSFSKEVCITISDPQNSSLSDTITIQKMSGIKRTYITALQWYEQRIDDIKEMVSLVFGRYVPYYWNLLLSKMQGLFS